VLYAVLALAVGVATNAWHKNTASGLVILISALAISVWLGTELGKK
jgi:hypothetical protein